MIYNAPVNIRTALIQIKLQKGWMYIYILPRLRRIATPSFQYTSSGNRYIHPRMVPDITTSALNGAHGEPVSAVTSAENLGVQETTEILSFLSFDTCAEDNATDKAVPEEEEINAAAARFEGPTFESRASDVAMHASTTATATAIGSSSQELPTDANGNIGGTPENNANDVVGTSETCTLTGTPKTTPTEAVTSAAENSSTSRTCAVSVCDNDNDDLFKVLLMALKRLRTPVYLALKKLWRILREVAGKSHLLAAIHQFLRAYVRALA